jgi:prepilin-type N-terminal cleavage/methylation domain-containing protein
MRRAFTLIELLIVVAMLAVVSLVALPRLRMERSQVDGTARTISIAMLAARSDAIARGHNVLIVFDTAKKVVRTVWDANNNLRIDAGEHTRPAMLGERVSFSRGAGVPAYNGATEQFPAMMTVDGKPAMVVQRNGALDRGGTLYVSATRAQASGVVVDSRALRIDRASGHATVYVYAKNGWRLQ